MTTTKRKSYMPVHAAHNYKHSVKASFRNMFMNCRRFCWTHEFMLQKRNELLCGNGVLTKTGQWERLTVAEQSELFGYWEALHDTLIAELEGRYLINGKWYLPREVCDHADGTDPSRDCSHENYHWVHCKHTENGPEYAIYA